MKNLAFLANMELHTKSNTILSLSKMMALLKDRNLLDF